MPRRRTRAQSRGAAGWTPRSLIGGILERGLLREEGRRLAGLGVPLQPANDSSPRVVDGRKLGGRKFLRPAGVFEANLVTGVLHRNDLPRDGRALPLVEPARSRPFHERAGLELIDSDLELRPVETESGDRAHLWFRLAVCRPEAGEPLG